MQYMIQDFQSLTFDARKFMTYWTSKISSLLCNVLNSALDRLHNASILLQLHFNILDILLEDLNPGMCLLDFFSRDIFICGEIRLSKYTRIRRLVIEYWIELLTKLTNSLFSHLFHNFLSHNLSFSQLSERYPADSGQLTKQRSTRNLIKA